MIPHGPGLDDVDEDDEDIDERAAERRCQPRFIDAELGADTADAPGQQPARKAS